jgi:hypothetical protein
MDPVRVLQARSTPSFAAIVLLCGLLPTLASLPAAQVGTLRAEQKISATAGGFGGTLHPSDHFGQTVAALGDLDGDGIVDLAVGAPHDDDGGLEQGAVWILFLDLDGTVQAEQKISATAGGFGGDLDPGDYFGSSVAALGDIDGDGASELAVGAVGDDDGGGELGAVWILSLNPDATVRLEHKISQTQGGFGGSLRFGDSFGGAAAALGDVDGDGIGDLAVGAPLDDQGEFRQGSIWILFLNADLSVKGEQHIGEGLGGFGGQLDPEDVFGWCLAALGDLDGDGTPDLAAGAYLDGDGGPFQGAVWVLFLNPDGSVRAEQKISETAGGFAGQLDPVDGFGTSVAALSDLDGDGITDLAVGAWEDDDGGINQGALWILFLDRDGTVKAERKISETSGGFGGELHVGDYFGYSATALGDLDGDGTIDLAAGAFYDDDGGLNQGAVWVLFLRGPACLTLDLETEDDFATPLVNGQHIDTEFGGLVTLTGAGPNAGLAIFDSTPGGPNDPSQDRDLLVGTGNILILQTENFPPDEHDVFPRPNDDEDGGTMTFRFTGPVSLTSVRLIDVDASDGATSVMLVDAALRRRTYTVPPGWTGDLLLGQPGQGVLDLTTLESQPGFGSIATAMQEAGFDPDAVVELAVYLDGSGGLDDLGFCSAGLPRAAVSVRNGSGVNARNLAALSLPVLGTSFEAELDCTEFAQGVAMVAVRRLPCSGPRTPFGELLITGELLSSTTRAFSGAPSRIAWNVPNDLSLLGTCLHVQGFCRAASGPAPGKARVLRGRLSNALDLTLGF